MADFQTPFSNTGSKRSPTAEEKLNGFPCGPADQTLFNGLFNRIEAEIGEVISHAGIVGSDADLTQLRQAIIALIQAETGGGDTSQFLLTSQAVARLPIFPEIQSADFKINVSSPAAGTVRVPAGVAFIHRGVVEITTIQTDFATTASSTYHVRWNPTDGYTLEDLADTVAYNPSSLAETDAGFDTAFDDMLIARVITNASNVATITNLANTQRLDQQSEFEETLSNSNKLWLPLAATSVTLDWARTPRLSLNIVNGTKSNNATPWGEFNTTGGVVADLSIRDSVPTTRYSAPNVEYAYDDNQNNDGRVRFTRSFLAH